MYVIIRCYGTRTLLKCWNENRLMKSFETVVEVNEGIKTESRKIIYGEKKPRGHTGSSCLWDKKKLEEVKFVNTSNVYHNISKHIQKHEFLFCLSFSVFQYMNRM